jgi:hypothetical protein
MLKVVGAAPARYSLELFAESTRRTAKEAREAVDRLDLTCQGHSFRLAPGGSAEGSAFVWNVLAPSHLPVTVTGACASVEIANMVAAVTVESSHGRTAVLNSTGDTRVVAREGGWIVWSGRKGRVILGACG